MDDRDTATDDDTPDDTETTAGLRREADFAQRAAHIYAGYRTVYKKKFRFLPAHLFTPELATDLQSDCAALLAVLGKCADWRAGLDQKLAALWTLAKKTHPKQKILVFTQFADTAEYLAQGLADMGVSDAGCATGQSGNVSQIAAAFSPVSNGKRAESSPEKQLRVLIATDVLSEGQNLQDAHIVVNYDLPWAIIRLIQRAGRVDRIGQQAATILCYSFLPADGVENIIRLRGRVTQRLGQNGEVVGSDELFFEDQLPSTDLRNLYNEAEGLLDGAGDDAQADTDTDLVSYAHGIWTAATKNNPALKKRILDLPNVVYSAKAHVPFGKTAPDGVLAFVQTGDGSNTLAYVDKSGAVVSESQYAILKAAECAPDTPAVPRGEWHHDAMERTVKRIVQNDSRVGASLGRASGARFKTYETIKRHAAANRETLFDFDGVDAALTELLQAPLTQGATDVLNMHLRNGANDAAITNLVLLLRDENRLCVRGGDNPRREPRILCSLGLVSE